MTQCAQQLLVNPSVLTHLKRPIFSTLVWEQTFEKNWNRSAPNSPLSVHRRSDLCIPYIDVTPLICTASWLSDDIVHCRVAHRFVSPPWGVVGRHRMAFDPCFHFSPDITASVDTQLHKWLLWSCRAGVIIRISVLFFLGPLYKTDYFFGFFSLKIHKNMRASLVHDVPSKTSKCDVLGCVFSSSIFVYCLTQMGEPLRCKKKKKLLCKYEIHALFGTAQFC